MKLNLKVENPLVAFHFLKVGDLFILPDCDVVVYCVIPQVIKMDDWERDRLVLGRQPWTSNAVTLTHPLEHMAGSVTFFPPERQVLKIRETELKGVV